MVPRVIWILWLQGWSQAPPIVQACLASWRALNPGWRVEPLSAPDVARLLGDDELLAAVAGKPLEPEAYSDIIRIALLRRYGGVWADATVYCVKGLDDWLPQAGFFAFSSPGPDRMLSSWFLAAERNDHIVKAWWDRSLAYWKGRESRDHYFWFHYLFGDAYRTDLMVKAQWDAAPKISADLPHYYLPHHLRLPAEATADDRLVLQGDGPPVLKLTHRVSGGPGSVYEMLCSAVAAEAG